MLISSIRRKHFKISCGLLCILYSVLLRKAKHDLAASLAPEPPPWHGVCPQAHSGCDVAGPLSRLPGGSYGSTPALLSETRLWAARNCVREAARLLPPASRLSPNKGNGLEFFLSPVCCQKLHKRVYPLSLSLKRGTEFSQWRAGITRSRSFQEVCSSHSGCVN